MEFIKSLLQSLNLTQAFQLIEQGGAVVVILILLSMFATTLIILKTIQVFWCGIGHKSGTERAVQLWLQGRSKEAYSLVEKSSNPTRMALAHLMRGLSLEGLSKEELREDVERVALKGLGQARAFLRPLEAVVQIAPLLGLFGTVLGMIEAFQTLQNAGSEADPAVLAGGIWVALLTTAVGLAVAIPVAFILSWFEGRIEAERLMMQDAITSLMTGRKTQAKEKQTLAPVPNKAVSHAT